MVTAGMGVLAALVLIGVLSCLTAWSMSKILNTFTTLFLFVFMLLLIIAGAIFMVPGQMGEKFVTDGCLAANTEDYSKINANFKEAF
jgi:hypothetical protein